MKAAKSLPVLMYHYINRWAGPISVLPELFEEHCRVLAEAGYKGISLKEAEDYLLNGEPIPEKSILFTFDDGFLDNYVYAWPYLKKYGHKGVICAVASKVTSWSARPTIMDIESGLIEAEELPRVDQPFMQHPLGYKMRRDLFISWSEAKLMEEFGDMSIIPHSLNHRSVFAGPSFDGVYAPGDRTRTFDRIDSEVPWGLPRFTPVPALANAAFKIAPEFIEAIKNMVPQSDEEAFEFFSKSNALEKMHAFYANWQGRMGVMETAREREARLWADFVQSKKITEEGLGHSVISFCWPWGAHDEVSLRIGRESGFKVFFSTQIGANLARKPLVVKRFKAKSNPGDWLVSRCNIYSSPMLSKVYTLIRQKVK